MCFQGKSPPQPIWVPEIKGPGGSGASAQLRPGRSVAGSLVMSQNRGFGLDPKIDNIWKFDTGPETGSI